MHWTSKHHGVLDCGCQIGADMRLLSECPAHRRYAPVELTEQAKREMEAVAGMLHDQLPQNAVAERTGSNAQD